jgi:hypothetical protein
MIIKIESSTLDVHSNPARHGSPVKINSNQRTEPVSNQPWPGWSAHTCATHGAMCGHMRMHDHWYVSPVSACAASTRVQLRHTQRGNTAACRAVAVKNHFFPFDRSTWLTPRHPHTAKDPGAIAEPFASNEHFHSTRLITCDDVIPHSCANHNSKRQGNYTRKPARDSKESEQLI